VYRAAHGSCGVDIGRAPILMLRPRAWNMVDHAVMIDGRKVNNYDTFEAC
jgi:hypothetical protein